MGGRKKQAWKMRRRARQAARTVTEGQQPAPGEAPDTSQNWDVPCENDGQKPTVGKSQLCGPCFFGEADTVNGDW